VADYGDDLLFAAVERPETCSAAGENGEFSECVGVICGFGLVGVNRINGCERVSEYGEALGDSFDVGARVAGFVGVL
jgi:hypothetical protein